MTEIFTARSIEEAKELAAKKFGKSISEIKFEILDEGKKGLFGIGSKEAKVKATVADAAPAAAPKAAVEAPKAPVTTAPAPKAEEPATKTVAEPKPVVTTETKAEPKAAEAKNETAAEAVENPAEAVDDEEAYSLDNFTLIEDESLVNPKVKLAKDYITSILRAMDVDVEFKVYQNETGAVINIESNNNGTIIGRRGETLDALQYLASLVANHNNEDYIKVTVNVGNYRDKREKTLEILGRKLAFKAIKTGKKTSLEPMNPYERRIIHTAVQKVNGAISWSEGENTARHVVIGPDPKYKNNNRRGGGYNRRGGKRGGYNNSRNTNPAPNPDRTPLNEGGTTGLYGRIDK